MDTNIVVSSMSGSEKSPRAVLRACLEKKVQPILGEALFLEYEEVLNRPDLAARSPLSASERESLLAAFLSVCEWIDIYYGWRPNLPDEGDNHLVELAVAGGANWIVTNNVRDFKRAELKFPEVQIGTSAEFLEFMRGEARK